MAHGGGSITFTGGASVTERGVCWSTSPNPTVADDKTSDGAGIGDFASDMTGLTSGTTYYVRAYATNSKGTGYGGERTFKTTVPVLDIDDNIYPTVQIGNQVWMAENLKVTRYRNGNTIPNVTGEAQWGSLASGAYCNYNNDPNNADTYGRLYNELAVTDSRGLAPPGYHVASVADWQTLADYLGGTAVAGGKMKEAGTAHWNSPNEGATNESGFSALPAGQRGCGMEDFCTMGLRAAWWSSTECGLDGLNPIMLDYDFTSLWFIGCSDGFGYSVRCIKD